MPSPAPEGGHAIGSGNVSSGASTWCQVRVLLEVCHEPSDPDGTAESRRAKK